MDQINVTEAVAHLVLQLGMILVAAKLAGELFERWLRQPSVLGELLAGVAIGPYALGGIDLPAIGALFGHAPSGEAPAAIPVSLELWSIAQIGSVILLFVAGLETDFHLFFRYGRPAIAIALGGIILPFALGDLIAVAFGLAAGPTDPVALFVGTIMTATSVGITARVLGDLGRLETPEGITILAAAVIDDVLSILVLAIVVKLGAGGQPSASDLALVGVRAIGFWLVLLAGGILLSRWISHLLFAFQSGGAMVALTLALAFLAAALAEIFGLAMIIGAYTLGLALSRTNLAQALREQMEGLYHVFVPVFFVVMGMLVDFQAMLPVLFFGLVLSLLAILGKVAGCGLPALLVGFNPRGGTRIGIGMMPRGEVALIVAGVGLGQGIVGADVFGVSIMMTFVTTVLAPILLVPIFEKGGSGVREGAAGTDDE